MRTLFANYAHLYRLYITHIWHSTSTLRHYIWCISQTCYFHLHRLSSTTHMWHHTDWLLLSHLPVLTTATSSLWVSWCPVHISAAAMSPSCGQHILCLIWNRVITFLHYVNSTGFPAVTARIQCKLCWLLHNSRVSHSLQYLSQLLTPVSDIPSRSALRSVRNSDFDVPRLRQKMARAFCIAALLEYSVHSWL